MPPDGTLEGRYEALRRSLEGIDDETLEIPRGNQEYTLPTSNARIVDVAYPVMPLAMRKAAAIRRRQIAELRRQVAQTGNTERGRNTNNR